MGTRNRTLKVLNVAGNRSIAENISKILSNNEGLIERESHSNKVYEFNYTIQKDHCQMTFTSVNGHLTETCFQDDDRPWDSCDPLDLFDAPIIKRVPKESMNIIRTLEEEARKCQRLILWFDDDREGEHIAFQVAEVCKRVNFVLCIRRAHFSSLIDGGIHQAAQQLALLNGLLSDAVDVGKEIDLRLGAVFTRYQTLSLNGAFDFSKLYSRGENTLVLSYDTCQFAILGFLVERYWAIKAHKAERIWRIWCSHKTDGGTTDFNLIYLSDYTSAELLYRTFVDNIKATVTVTQVRQQNKLISPPQPLNTIELLKRASDYLKMSSEQTMKIAQDLYQSGFISNPCTAADCFTTSYDLRSLVREQKDHPEWGRYGQRLLDCSSGLWRDPSGGGHGDGAHPPLHPIKYSSGESGWSEDHKMLYELVVRHYLACVSQPAVEAVTTVEIEIAGHVFSALGRTIVNRGYLDVYRYESWSRSPIPDYTVGYEFTPTLTLNTRFTSPPPFLSESDLLDCIDKACIRTDAMVHDHIKKLTDSGYAIKEGSHLKPTELGVALVTGYADMGITLWKPYLRRVMEEDMKAVSVGYMKKDDVLKTCLTQLKDCFLDVRENKGKLFQAFDAFFGRKHHAQFVRTCDVCHDSDMVIKQTKKGRFLIGCSAHPQCDNAIWLDESVSAAVVTDTVCDTCTSGPIYKIKFTFRPGDMPEYSGDTYTGCVGGCDDARSRVCARAPARGRGITAPSRDYSQNNQQQQALAVHVTKKDILPMIAIP